MNNSGINLRSLSNKSGARGDFYMLSPFSKSGEGQHQPANNIAQLYTQQTLGVNLGSDAIFPQWKFRPL